MMLPDRGQSPADQWYYQPLTDRSAIGQQKIDQLQRQINSLEDDSQERQRLIERLTRLQEKEREQKGLQDRVISRNSPVSRLLQDEVEKLYGAESVAALNPSRTPVDRNVMEKVIQHRTKEFSNKQQEAALQAKYLDKERQRLQEARHRVQEQRRMLLSSVSPSGKTNFPANYPASGGGLSFMPHNMYSRGYPNLDRNRSVPIVSDYNNMYGGNSNDASKYGSYPNADVKYEGGILTVPRNKSTVNSEMRKSGYLLDPAHTYKSNTDFEKKIEVAYRLKPFHVKEMNMEKEYDVYVTDPSVYSKPSTKMQLGDGPIRKTLIKYKDIDQIKGIERKPHLSTDLYSSNNLEPTAFIDPIRYKLPGNMNYPWLPVIHSVFDSLENRMANSEILPIMPKEQEMPKRPKTRVKYKFVPVLQENSPSRYGLPREIKSKSKKKKKRKYVYVPTPIYDPHIMHRNLGGSGLRF